MTFMREVLTTIHYIEYGSSKDIYFYTLLLIFTLSQVLVVAGSEAEGAGVVSVVV